MIAVEIPRPYSQSPAWWQNFTSSTVSWPVWFSSERHTEFKEYVQRLNDHLISQGGRLHWQTEGGRILLTFREDENFTAFLLRWA